MKNITVKLFHLIIYNTRLKSLIFQLNNLDKIKKALFYGKELPWCPYNFSDSCKNIPHWLHDEDEKEEMILHSIIGAATEIGEMLECLSNVFSMESRLILSTKKKRAILFGTSVCCATSWEQISEAFKNKTFQS